MKNLERAMEIFEVPCQFYNEAKLMLKESELELICAVGKIAYSFEELSKIILDNNISENPEEFIKDCYSRNVISKVEDDKTKQIKYQLSNFYARFPYYAQYENEDYVTKIPKDRKKALNDWDLEVYVGIYGNDVREKVQGLDTNVHNQTFLTLDEAYKYVEKHKDSINIIPCNCKCMMDVYNKSKNVCMEFNSGINSSLDRGHGQTVDVEEAKKLLKEFNKRGLMQNGEDYAICNCDGGSCYPLQMARTIGSKGIYPKSNYNIDWHEDECVNCGKCTKICNFGAFYKDDNGKVKYDVDKCWGCTICAPNCPKNAIHLIKK